VVLALNGCIGPLYMAWAGTEWHNHLLPAILRRVRLKFRSEIGAYYFLVITVVSA
jgi:hypothetical protein